MDRRLARNLEVQRETLSCFTRLTTCFQWLHEEALNQPSAINPWVGPQRSSTLIPLKKVGCPPVIRFNIEQIHSSVVGYYNECTATHLIPPPPLPSPPPPPPLAQASSDQIINNVNTVKEKMQSQHFRISQRLQWAAGANPSLNVTLDDFERAVSKRNAALQVSPTPTVSVCVCLCVHEAPD